MELLAPAGSPEALTAAVQSGAGAVYLGYGDFNARRNAKNFGQEELAAAVSYCHLRGVKVYLTLNTLLTDRELPAALDTARLASRLGVDAVLVQDLGVARLLRETCPDLPLHASTQMTLHSLAGVEAAARLGMTRAVLSRELPADQIAAICRKSPIEIEVFVHGALCMCYSGQCALSSLIGGRSGNRGLCAQPCRLAYGWEGDKQKSYPLSLKDLSLADHLQELAAMGVACLKIEGRMKRAEYVAVVTGIYAALLREGRRPTDEERACLAAAFSRQGFTQGYYRDEKGPAMFGTRKEGAQDPAPLFAAAKHAYSRGESRPVPVEMTFTATIHAPARLTVTDGAGHTVQVEGPTPEPARSRPLAGEQAAGQLGKTGGTVFTCNRVEARVAEGISLPLSALNALRRKALEELERQMTTPPPRRELPFIPPAPTPAGRGEPVLTLSVLRLDQISPALLAEGPALVYLPLEETAACQAQVAQWVARYPDTTFAVTLPRVVWDREEDTLRRQLEGAWAAGIREALGGTLGPVETARGLGFALRGDAGLGLFNSLTAAELARMEFLSATASFELRMAQIRDLDKPLPVEAIIYGRLPLMVTENCILQAKGCPCGQGRVLRDRKGEGFPVLPAWGCRNELYNGKVLYLADKPQWKKAGLWGARLAFTTESGGECLALYRACREGAPPPMADFTRGLYFREVE